MTETLDISRRAVACKHWKWMQGMLDHTGYRLISETPTPSVWQLGRESCLGSLSGVPTLPNFTDPATVGCLLALVYEAHKGGIIPASRASQWFRDPAALVAALEAAS